ncbi:MAG: hypothetical protein JWR52_3123 [Marmoricola sp.]|nr:hypothetical protein [Marmoricola sp.]
MRVAIVPGVPALRPEYASIEDPVPELRAAVAEATRWLGSGRLVVANGSAKRTEKAPGYFDDRAAAFDGALGAALRAGDLSGLDLSLAGELWADVAGLTELAGVRASEVQVDYDDAPYGVQYWVVRWQCTP